MVQWAHVNVSQPPPRIRRHHRKGRSGCGNCKRRHIKCDEKSPQCGACLKKGLTCDRIPVPVIHQHVVTQCAGPLVSANAALDGPASKRSLDMQDLRLLHHFTTQTIVPPTLNLIIVADCFDVAFENPFVMHAILMLTATHMLNIDPDNSELQAAELEHLACASHGLQQELALGLKDRNIDAFFVASLLIYTQAWASPERRTDSILAENVFGREVDFLLPLAMALRQAVNYENAGYGLLMKSPIFAKAALYSPKEDLMSFAQHTSLAEDIREEFQSESRLHWPSAAEQALLRIYILECERLIPVLAVLRMSQRGANVTSLSPAIDRYLYTWPMLLSAEMLDMMRRGEPCAKLLLWHFYDTVRASPAYSQWWAQKRTDMMSEILLHDLEAASIHPTSRLSV